MNIKEKLLKHKYLHRFSNPGFRHISRIVGQQAVFVDIAEVINVNADLPVQVAELCKDRVDLRLKLHRKANQRLLLFIHFLIHPPLVKDSGNDLLSRQSNDRCYDIDTQLLGVLGLSFVATKNFLFSSEKKKSKSSKFKKKKLLHIDNNPTGKLSG